MSETTIQVRTSERFPILAALEVLHCCSSDIDRTLYSGSDFSRFIMKLGDLEAAVLGSVLRLTKASARQVAKDLEPSRGLAYSTIGTTLDRLYKKGVLGREEKWGGVARDTST